MSTTELKNSFREEQEREATVHQEPEVHPPKSVVAARRSGKLLGPNGAQLVKPVAQATPEVRLLRVGDKVRALGLVYRVRKVTNKDIVLRPVKS